MIWITYPLSLPANLYILPPHHSWHGLNQSQSQKGICLTQVPSELVSLGGQPLTDFWCSSTCCTQCDAGFDTVDWLWFSICSFGFSFIGFCGWALGLWIPVSIFPAYQCERLMLSLTMSRAEQFKSWMSRAELLKSKMRFEIDSWHWGGPHRGPMVNAWSLNVEPLHSLVMTQMWF